MELNGRRREGSLSEELLGLGGLVEMRRLHVSVHVVMLDWLARLPSFTDSWRARLLALLIAVFLRLTLRPRLGVSVRLSFRALPVRLLLFAVRVLLRFILLLLEMRLLVGACVMYVELWFGCFRWEVGASRLRVLLLVAVVRIPRTTRNRSSLFALVEAGGTATPFGERVRVK